ncbi:MAG: hypothetical protein OEV31_05785, partial [Gammaproteobacteria bacterium]|nr:hypothetical protein [Gammaproteobacteria bacterium]
MFIDSRPVLKPLALLAGVLCGGGALAQQAGSQPPLELRISPRLEEDISQEQRDAAPTYLSGQRMRV